MLQVANFSEIYTAPRMQHVVSVAWSLDSKFILSGSDEFNIRLWKANAAEKLGPVSDDSRSVCSLNLMLAIANFS